MEKLFSEEFDIEFSSVHAKEVYGKNDYLADIKLWSTNINSAGIDFEYEGYTFPITARIQFAGILYSMNGKIYEDVVKEQFPDLQPKVTIYFLDCDDTQKSEALALLSKCNTIEEGKRELEAMGIVYQSQNVPMDGTIREVSFTLEKPEAGYSLLLVGNVSCKGIAALTVE